MPFWHLDYRGHFDGSEGKKTECSRIHQGEGPGKTVSQSSRLRMPSRRPDTSCLPSLLDVV